MNNRQANNGRRRGRGGQQRPGGGNANQGNGNRIDNRARGNAAQLLEKYKSLARDAQMQGDRVNAEYYLQFADHYFRVLSETRSRFEEANPNQPQQRLPRNDIDGDDEEFGFESEGNRAEESRDEQPRHQQQRDARPEREPRQDREPRRDREPRQDREPREAREPRESRNRDDRDNRYRDNGRSAEPNGNAYAAPAPVETNEAPVAEAPSAPREETPVRRRGRPRREEAVETDAPTGIDAAILPPAFGLDAKPGNDEEEAPKKPRRRRTPRADEADVPAA